jgi:hypothetical protein
MWSRILRQVLAAILFALSAELHARYGLRDTGDHT